MHTITYRPLQREDYPRIKILIGEAFGFHALIQDEAFLDCILTLYLNNCILGSTYSQVAVQNNKVIGIILGEAKPDRHTIRKPHNVGAFLKAATTALFSHHQNRKIFKEFKKITQTYDVMMQGKKGDFEGCIQLFIVSKESRGLGVGKTLVHHLMAYMKAFSVQSLYLYTDTRCNYGFYDHQGFRRLAEKEVYFESFKDTLNVFLYDYQVSSY